MITANTIIINNKIHSQTTNYTFLLEFIDDNYVLRVFDNYTKNCYSFKHPTIYTALNQLKRFMSYWC